MLYTLQVYDLNVFIVQRCFPMPTYIWRRCKLVWAELILSQWRQASAIDVVNPPDVGSQKVVVVVYLIFKDSVS